MKIPVDKLTLPERYQRLIDIFSQLLATQLSQMHTYPVDRHPLIYGGFGRNCQSVAVGHAMLGNGTEARRWFHAAAEYYLKALPGPPDTVINEQRALETAVLSRDEPFLEQVAAAIPERKHNRKPICYPYVMFLKSTLLKQSAEASIWAHEADLVIETVMRKQGGYGQLGAACVALDGRAPAKLTAAIAALLDEHGPKAQRSYRNLEIGYVCFPAAVLILLSKILGVPTDVESQYLPPVLFD